MQSIIKKFSLEVIVFVCGASLMVLELVASRVMAPFFGTNTFVWTSLIGIILGCLSIGYWIGGKLADHSPNVRILSRLIVGTSFCVGIIYFANLFVLQVIQSIFSDIRIGVIVATLILFSVPSILLGMVSPYAVKLKLTMNDKAGSTVGKLYSLSTIGSIFGTFLTGFVLIPSLGTQKIILYVGITLLLLSLLASPKILNSNLILVSILYVSLLFFPTQITDLIDVDTQYSRIWIFDTKDTLTGKDTRYLRQDTSSSSAMYLETDTDLVFEYTKFYDLATHFHPQFQSSLMIGGAAYSYPKYYLQKYPDKTMDVVEIDPAVTSLAQQHFRLNEHPKLQIFHEDARVFLNQNTKKYDVIFGDAFQSHSPPYQLTTKEAVSKIYHALHPDGIVIMNIVSSIMGDTGKFLRAEYFTYKEVFPHVMVFPVSSSDENQRQNIMLVACKNPQSPSLSSENPELQKYLKKLWTKPLVKDVSILTDDYAPVDYLVNQD